MPKANKQHELKERIESAQEELEEAEHLLSERARQQVLGFLDFIRGQGVVGLATGIILGTVVTGVVRSLVDDIINPLIGLVLPEASLVDADVRLWGADVNWGSFVSSLLDFMIIAAVVYFGFRLLKLDKLDKKKK